MGDTPNTLTSMNVELTVKAKSLRDLLDHVNVNGMIDPVKVMFTVKGATVWAHDANKTLQVFVNDHPLEDYDLKSEPGCLIMETKRVSEMIASKFGSEIITVRAKSGEAVTLKCGGATLTYYPPAEDECFVVPDHWVMPMGNDGSLLYPMLENAKATLRCAMHPDELKKALVDMRVAGATYACIKFGKKDSVSEAGHWTAKTNTSLTPIDAKVIEGTGTVTFPEVLSAVVERLNGDTVEIHKHDDTPFFVLISGPTRILVTEAQRADND